MGIDQGPLVVYVVVSPHLLLSGTLSLVFLTPGATTQQGAPLRVVHSCNSRVSVAAVPTVL